MEAVVELRYRGCDCQPIGVEQEHPTGGLLHFVVHEDQCHLLWIRAARWN